MFQQLLVCEIYAELFERVLFEVLETKDIQEVDWFLAIFYLGIQGYLHFIDNELENCIINGFTQGITISYASQFTIGLRVSFF